MSQKYDPWEKQVRECLHEKTQIQTGKDSFSYMYDKTLPVTSGK